MPLERFLAHIHYGIAISRHTTPWRHHITTLEQFLAHIHYGIATRRHTMTPYHATRTVSHTYPLRYCHSSSHHHIVMYHTEHLSA